MAYELYYYGNGPVMAQVIESVKYVLNSPDYGTIIQVVLVLAGLLMVTAWHGANIKGRNGTHTLGVSMLTLLVLYYGAYAPKVDLLINDPLNSFVTSVQNAPIGLGAVLWASNQINRGLGDLFDASFSSSGFPDEFTYEHMGSVPAGLLTVAALGRITPNDAYLFMTIENYIKNCYMTAVLLGQKNINNIRTSTDLLDEISTNLSDAWTGTYYSSSNPQGVNEKCTQLYSDMKRDLTNAVDTNGSVSKLLLFFLRSLNVYGMATTTDAQNILQTAGSYMLGATVSSQNLLAQAVLINALNPQMLAFAEQNGFNPSAFNMAITQSALNTTTMMATSYALASTFLPMAYLVVSAFVVAILPLSFALMFVPSLTRRYGIMTFNLLTWLAFWGPIASVVNFLVQAFASHSYQTIHLGGNVTYGAFPFIMAHTQTLMSIAGDIMFSVPVIAFALSSGSAYAMTQVAGAVAGISRSFASGASSRMTTATGIRSEENAAEENLAEGQAVKDAGYSNKEIGRGLFDVERAAGMFAASRTDYFKNIFDTYSPSQVARSEAKLKAQSIGRGEGFTSLQQAETIGQLQTSQEIANMLGAWQDYQQARQNGYTGTFVQYLEQSARYRTAANIAEAQQMQKMADRYFGGNLGKEMQFLKHIQAEREIGGAFGFEDAYKQAVKDGFVGTRADFVRFNEAMHLESIYGQNIATRDAANFFGEDVPTFVAGTRRGSYMMSRIDSGVKENYINREGIPETWESIEKRLYYEQGRNLQLAPTPQEAKERGMWESKTGYENYLLNKGLYGTADYQAMVESAKRFSDTIIGRQIPIALTMDSNDIVFKSVAANVAHYLKETKSPGAFNEAMDVTEAEMKYLSGTLSQDIKHGNEQDVMSRVAGDLGVGAPKIVSPIKAGIDTNILSQITDSLSKVTGMNITENALRERLMSINYSIAASNPSNALQQQKEYFDNLRSAIKSGNMQKVADMLGYSYATPKDLNQQHIQDSNPAVHVQEQYDQVSSIVKEEVNLLKDTLASELKVKLTPTKDQMKGTNETFDKFGDLWNDWDVGGD